MSKIRITESELKQIVNESVQKILQELDWRTVANASREAARKSIEADLKGDKKEADKRFKQSGRLTRATADAMKQQNPSLKDKIDYNFNLSKYKDGKWYGRDEK